MTTEVMIANLLNVALALFISSIIFLFLIIWMLWRVARFALRLERVYWYANKREKDRRKGEHTVKEDVKE